MKQRLTVFGAGFIMLILVVLSLLWQRLFSPLPFSPSAQLMFIRLSTSTVPPTVTMVWPPTFTHTPISTSMPTMTTRPTATFTPTITASTTATASPTLPLVHDVPAFKVRHQLLSLDCESASATQWAGYFGVKINEIDFQTALPHSDNPDYGFVGNVNDPWGGVPPQGYGVYAGPVADLLNKYGVPALAVKNYSLDKVIHKILADSPVIAWVVGHVEAGTAYPIIDSRGRTAVVAAYEHVILVIGYTPDDIHYISEGVPYTVSIPTFLKSWSVLGNMVVVAP